MSEFNLEELEVGGEGDEALNLSNRLKWLYREFELIQADIKATEGRLNRLQLEQSIRLGEKEVGTKRNPNQGKEENNKNG